jgi:hypothetical protein
MKKGEFTYSILNAVSGGSPNPEIEIKIEDVEVLSPLFISTSMSMLDTEDVRSYRFDRVGFLYKEKKTLPIHTLQVDCDADGGFIQLDFDKGGNSRVEIATGKNIIPVYEDEQMTLAASFLPMFAWKEIRNNISYIRLEGLSKNDTIKVAYEAEFDNYLDTDDLPYNDIVLMRAIELGKQYFIAERMMPDDTINNNDDDIKRQQK